MLAWSLLVGWAALTGCGSGEEAAVVPSTPAAPSDEPQAEAEADPDPLGIMMPDDFNANEISVDLADPVALAIDAGGTAWVVDSRGLVRLSDTGADVVRAGGDVCGLVAHGQGIIVGVGQRFFRWSPEGEEELVVDWGEDSPEPTGCIARGLRWGIDNHLHSETHRFRVDKPGLHPVRPDGTAHGYDGDRIPAETRTLSIRDGGVDLDGRQWMWSAQDFEPLSFHTAANGTLWVLDAVDGGKIWQVTHVDYPVGEPVGLLESDLPTLVDALQHSSGYVRRSAQQLLVLRRDLKSRGALTRMALTSEEPLGRLHALWTMDGIGWSDPHLVLSALRDPDARVRAGAVQICEPWIARGDREAIQALGAVAGDRDAQVVARLVRSLAVGDDANVGYLLKAALDRGLDEPEVRRAALASSVGREDLPVKYLLGLEYFERLGGPWLEGLVAAPFLRRDSDVSVGMLEALVGVDPQFQISVLERIVAELPDVDEEAEDGEAEDGEAEDGEAAAEVDDTEDPEDEFDAADDFERILLDEQPAVFEILSNSDRGRVRNLVERTLAWFDWSSG